MGAGYIVIPDYPDWLDQIHSLTGRLQGADHVIEASGMSEADAAFEAALSKRRGKYSSTPRKIALSRVFRLICKHCSTLIPER